MHKLGDCHSKEEQGSLPDVAVSERITGEEEDLVAKDWHSVASRSQERIWWPTEDWHSKYRV